MDIGAILFILGLLGLVVAFVGRPLLEREGQKVTREDVEFSSLLAQRDHILDALEELDMDRTMKKVEPEAYDRRRAELMREGADVLRQLDSLNAELATPEPAEGSIDEAIEEQIQRLRQDQQSEHGQRTTESKVSYCPACGAKTKAADRFCTNCGESLVEEVST
jgi:hypothetical protein